MEQPAVQQITQQSTSSDTLDPAEEYAKRRRTALLVTIGLLSLSMVVLAVGLVSATRTDNVAVAGYYPGIILSFGAFLGIVGMHLLENRRPMLLAAIIFISVGVIASSVCAIVDGIIAAEFIDSRPLLEDGCAFYTSWSGYAYDNYYTEVTCRSYSGDCKLRVQSNTCYCCYLYNCESTSPQYHAQYYEFTGVSGCWDVVHLHRLLWTSVVLNVFAVFLGIISAALLGAYKDLPKPPPQGSCSPTPPPHILYNPSQHMLSYPGFCPSYPGYPVPLQHHTPPQPVTPPQPPPEGAPTSTSSCPSDESRGPSLPPPGTPSQAPHQECPQDPYALTPNAPALYGTTYSPFEKPPPYAY